VQQSGEYLLRATRANVWRALGDPDILAKCIDGCETFVRTGENAFKATARARIGPLSGVFAADIHLTDLDLPDGYTLRVSVDGGPAGSGKAAVRVALSEDSSGTMLRYAVAGSVGGELAKVDQKIIDSAADKVAEDFFDRFSGWVNPGVIEGVGFATPVNRTVILATAALGAVTLAALAALMLRH
jgi:uncharacterized protein